MEIKKYKYIGNSKYKVFIDEKEYILYEDVIIKNNILLNKNISKSELDIYLKENIYYDALDKSIKYISIKLRSKSQVIKYLENKYDSLVINKIISILEERKYIDDDAFSIAYINDKINLKNDGPYKIRYDLNNLGISKDIIDKNIVIFNKDLEFNKIDKIINKELKLNNNKSIIEFKNNIYYKLYNLGYSKEYISILVNDIIFDERKIYNREYDKLYKKLSNKFDSNKLDYIVCHKLYDKGFRIKKTSS